LNPLHRPQPIDSMPIITARALRIIAGELDPRAGPAHAKARRFEYAALAREERAQIVSTPSCEQHGQDGAAEHAPPSEEMHRTAASSTDTADGNAAPARSDDRGAAPSREADALGERVSGAAQPVVDALARVQHRFLALAVSVAHEVAAFCSDPAISGAGNWEVQLPLDGAIFPDTMLYLSLSHFTLSLRFDTQSTQVRQLVLQYSALLERELDALLRASNAPRDIELTVW
jgi:type III secretion control protein HpaP